MTISLNDKVIKKSGLSIGEVLLMIAIQNNVDFEEAEKELTSKGLISTSYDPETHLPASLFVTNKGNGLLAGIILDSDKDVGSQEFSQRIEALVPQLQAIFPEGKNFNNQYWRGNKTDIKRKLQTFFKKYGNDYTDEQIINATKSYVSGFNSIYQYMRLLQYFIWKEEIKDGVKVPISELANHIENAGQNSNQDWEVILK